MSLPGLALLAVLLLPIESRPVSPVRFLDLGTAACSAVVTGPQTALTAGHCMRAPANPSGHAKLDGLDVQGFETGADRAALRPISGSFLPPYARPAPLGKAVLIEGFGCDQSVSPYAVTYRRTVRRGAVLPVTGAAGQEIVFVGVVCHGDSGGALWTDHGGLAGIVTHVGVGTRVPVEIGYATPAM